eukprot:1221685-Amphidinium_carterae.1
MASPLENLMELSNWVSITEKRMVRMPPARTDEAKELCLHECCLALPFSHKAWVLNPRMTGICVGCLVEVI